MRIASTGTVTCRCVDRQRFARHTIRAELRRTLQSASGQIGAQGVVRQHSPECSAPSRHVLRWNAQRRIADDFGRLAASATITGVPHAMASSGGKPNPS
jgi:hypothetical protein